MPLLTLRLHSCAAPTFAAVITLLNDARRNADKKPLGYLNHVIYKVRFITGP